MLRRITPAIVLIVCAAIPAFAIERATFILTDGERKSGTVVFHGDQRENLINGYLNLGVDNAKEMTFPMDQVAVIDFVGGQPPQTELAQLGAGHMLVIRGGTTQQGRLINLVGGDTLLWENAAKQRQQYAIHDISRVYLNPESARTAFGYVPPAPPAAVATPAPTPGGTQTGRNPATPANPGNQTVRGNQGNRGSDVNQGSQDGRWNQGADRSQGNDRSRDDGSVGNTRGRREQGTNGQSVTVRLDPRERWAETGITVNRGDRLVFEASVAVREILARIGNGSPFVIDTRQQSVVMPSAGPLVLGASDNERRADRGPFSVVVSEP